MALEFEKTTLDEDLPPGSEFKGPRSAAPRRKAASPNAKTTGTVPWVEIEESLTATYMMAGGFLAMTPRVPERVRPVGQALMMNATQCTEAWIEAAKKNPKLAKALTKFVSGSSYAGLISAHMPVLLAVAMAVNPRVVPVEGLQEKDAPETSFAEAPGNVSPLFNIPDVGL